MSSVRLAAQRLLTTDALQAGLNQVVIGMQFLNSAGQAHSLTKLRSVSAPVKTSVRQIAQIRVNAGEILSEYAARVSDMQDQARALQLRQATALEQRRQTELRVRELRADDPESVAQTQRITQQQALTATTLTQIEQALNELDRSRQSLDRASAQRINESSAALVSLSTSDSNSMSFSESIALFAAFAAQMARNAQALGIPELRSILDGGRSPEQVAGLWSKTGLDGDAVSALPIESLILLANTDGLPFWVRDIGSRRVVDYAKKWPTGAYTLMGFAGDAAVDPEALAEFSEQIDALDAAVHDATDRAGVLTGRPEIQLLGIANRDGIVGGIISTGNADTASHIGVNVPGMNADMRGIGNGVSASQSLYESASGLAENGEKIAVITWFDYRTPGYGGVLVPLRAQVGANSLASFIDGIGAVRADHTAAQVAVFAHSYGSTTAAEALKQTHFRINTFGAYGSAGFQSGTTRGELNADSVYATQADADPWAPTGQHGSFRKNPIDIDGIEPFSAEGKHGEAGVTVHDMFTSGQDRTEGGRVGYLSVGTTVANEFGHVLVNGKLR